jgi:uridine kinase
MPAPASRARAQLIERLADRIIAIRPARVSVVVDGFTASGKTSFAHELAAQVRERGRPTMRATLDDFKKPWRDAREKGYDRVSGEGYYRNAPDFDSARTLLLEPARPGGSGVVALCGHDPLTGADHRGLIIEAPADAVLIVDSVFGMRPEYDEFWDFRIWLEIAPDEALARGIQRDTESEGREEAERLHRDRYGVAEQIYISEVDPKAKADTIIDNTDYANPVCLR